MDGEARHAAAAARIKAPAVDISTDPDGDLPTGRTIPCSERSEATQRLRTAHVHAKMLRLELLDVKKEPEREVATHLLNCSKCGLDVHWVSGLGITPGHWSHAEPAPHGEPRSRQCGSKLATLRLPPTQPAPDLSR
jgi:hypothetical protein